LALAARRSNVLLLERNVPSAAMGAAILLQPNGIAVLDGLGVLDRVRDRATVLRSFRMYDTRGRVRAEAAIPHFGGGLDHALVLRRQHLADCLRAAIRDSAEIDARDGAAVVSASDDGAITYIQGGERTRLRAGLVIGADGVGSAVRGTGRFGPRTIRSGRRYIRAVVDGTFDLPPGECWSALGLIGWASLGDGSTYLYASASDGAIHAALERRDTDDFVTRWSAAVPFAAGLLGRIRSMGDLVVNDAATVRCRTFVDGYRVLVGDAAHAMEPNLGQGANSALVDAVVLVAELATHDDQAGALAAYDKERRKAVARVQRNAARLAKVAHFRNPVIRASRDRLLSLLNSPFVVQRQARVAQQVDPAHLRHVANQFRVRPNSS
jgi:2-polyprenyl-6-methoxyphenol hydroxylase-like FAD-dependent oxidoreductase